MRIIVIIWLLAGCLLFPDQVKAAGEEGGFNPKEAIFEHLGDEYGWAIGSFHLPLPVILLDETGNFHLFSSSKITAAQEYEGFRIAAEGEYAGKVVGRDAAGMEYRPWDFSVTKNVFALMITGLAVCAALFPLVRWYRRKAYQAPRRVKGMMEMIIEMLYQELIVSILGKEGRRYAPYLLTVFFFILFANLLGLIVMFPGGANLMGNISVTMVLAFCTFVVVNVSGTREYWKEIFWPDVPRWLKCPVPMMPVIELFGLFTKPVALMIRLFANMLGGHLIALVLVALIFVFGALGSAVMGGTIIVSVLFSIFMGMVDLLICFIQAYVFMMLSTIFIALARVEHEK